MMFSLEQFLKLSFFVISFCFFNTSFSQEFQEKTSYYNHLLEINKEWVNYPNACQNAQISFDSDIERIQTHLELVITHLRTNLPENLSSIQINKRLHLLDALAIYANEKTFPTNNNHSIRMPYFVDSKGIHCAVGQLMHVSGNDTLVADIRKDYNYSYIADIKTKGVTEWCKEYGFTINELKWIQPGYLPPSILKEAGEGSNGSIKKLYKDEISNRLIISGDFDTLNQLPCLNIGKYENGQLSCLGNGLVGVINDVKSSLFGIIAFGQLVHNGITYPIAHYNGTTWAYYTHPSIPNAVAQSGYVSDYYSEIAIDGNTGGQEIWSLDFANNVWEQKAKTNGVVLTIISSDTGQIYAGHFDTIITFSSQIDTIGNLYNVIIHDSTNTNWFSLGSEIPDTIKIVKEIGGKLYFGGACSMPNNPTCLSRLQGDSLNAILLSNDLTPFGIPGPFFTSVNSIFPEDQNTILIGGNFQVWYGMSIGYQLGKFELPANIFRPVANLNGAVNSLNELDSTIFVGGAFTNNSGVHMNHLAILDEALSLKEESVNSSLKAFPNPFTNEIILKGVNDGVNFTLINILGQIVSSGNVMNQKISNLEGLSKGVYVLQLNTESGQVTQTILK